MQPSDENRGTSLPQCLSDHVSLLFCPTNVSQELPPAPPLRKSPKHRPMPLGLSPARQHLPPLDSNNLSAIEDYLFSSPPASANANVCLGIPSPMHGSERNLLNLVRSNPPLTPVPPLRTSPLPGESETTNIAQSSPGLPPASRRDRLMDDIFVEFLQTESSFLQEVNAIEVIIQEILAPLGIADDRWLHFVQDIKHLYRAFVQDLVEESMGGISPTVLKVLLKWVCTCPFDSHSSLKLLVLGMEYIFQHSGWI